MKLLDEGASIQMIPFAAAIHGFYANFVAGLVVIIFLYVGVSAVGPLLREITFYRSKKWDFLQDSGFQIYDQQALQRRFSFLPIGILKLLFYLNRLIIMFIVVVPLVYGLSREYFI